MKRFYILLLSLSFFTFNVKAITKTVGTSGDYADLQVAFNAINTGAITGDIVLQIISNVYQSSAVPILYYSGYGGVSSYTSVTIYPTGSGYSIYCTSSFTANGVIRLDGADNVTIDGRVNQSGAADLTIYNPSISPSNHNLSTLLLINGATNNTVKYCNLQGSSLAYEAGTYDGGLIYFAGSSGTSGNSNNTIEYCNITNYGGNRVINVIYSFGASSYWNSNNTIRYNNIYDVLYKSSTSYTTVYGIYLSDYNTDWTITGNNFYETSSMTLSNSNGYQLIRIASSSNYGNNFTVTNNYLGGSGAACSGTWTKTNYNSPFYGIYMHVGNSTASNIQGNTIKGFNWTNSDNSSWYGIYVNFGNVNIGTTSGNTIGASTGNGSITLTNSTGTGAFYGIYYTSSTSASNTGYIQNNTIGSITTDNSHTAHYNTNLYGIYNSSSFAFSLTFDNNIIGSTSTSNSLYATAPCAYFSSSSDQYVYGIYSSQPGTVNITNNTIANLTNGLTNSSSNNASVKGIYIQGAGTYTITDNTIRNLTITNYNNTNTGYQAPIIGICYYNASATTAQYIAENIIYNLSATSTAFNGNMIGLYYYGGSSQSTVDANFIHSFSTAYYNCNLIGMKTEAGVVVNSNNIVYLGSSTSCTIYGIYELGSNNSVKYYYNTVYIAGTQSTNNLNSYAFYNLNNSNTRNIRNNVFFNARTNSGTSGKHYAVQLAGTTNVTINYNNYYVTGTGGVLGYLSSDRTTLANWQTATGQDGNSVNTNPSFVSAGSTTATDYTPATSMNGTEVSGIYNDYSYNPRPSTPTMGAFEINVMPDAVDVYIGGSLTSSYKSLNAAFAKINDGTHQGAITLKIKNNCIETSSATLNASGSGSASYSSVTIYPTSSSLKIYGNMSQPLIYFNGADNVTLDGRENAGGSTASLTIYNENSDASANNVTLRLANGASSNTIKYCNIQGSCPNSNYGMIDFSTSSGSSGNSSNVIEYCNLTNYNSVRPFSVIKSSGSSGYENNSNTICYNNIYNFMNEANTSYGINVGSYSSEWTITGNSFYETSSLVPTNTSTTYFYPVYINNTSGNNFTVSNNYFGGSAAQCSGTWTKTNAKTNYFQAIYMAVGSSTASNIQGNTIKGFNWSNAAAADFYAVYLAGGSINLGTTSGNTIGASTGTASVTLTNATGGSAFYGIYMYGQGTYDIQNNTIGAITTANASANSTNFFGIYEYPSSSSTVTISYNTIGSTSTSGSINTSSASSSSAQYLAGIFIGNTGTKTITYNTIANLTNSTTNTTGTTTGYVIGIYMNSGTNTVSYNTIRDLTIANANNRDNINNYPGAVTGIYLQYTTANSHTISNNTIYNLTNTYSTFQGSITGISFYGSSSQSDIFRNFIHSLSATGASATSSNIVGIGLYNGQCYTYNNIISLSGTLSNNTYGIYEYNQTNNTMGIYFNSVYLTGTLTSGSSNSQALRSISAYTRNFRNNLLVNTRSNSGASGKHYSIMLNSTSSLTINYNDYYVSGSGTVLGYLAADKTTLADWKTATSQDVNSLNTNPGFVNAGGTSASDYMPKNPGSTLTGTTITGYSTDYSGKTRAGTPTMGAYEQAIYWDGGASTTNWATGTNWSGNSTPSSGDHIIIPSTSYNPELDQSRTIGSLTIESGASITVPATYTLTVNGSISNNNGNSGIVLQSNATGTGSLITSSSVAGTAQRYWTGGTQGSQPGINHYVSIPVSSASGADLIDASLGNYNVYTYTSNAWSRVFDSDNLTVGKGYVVAYNAAKTKSFTGTLNTGDITNVPISSTNDDWNLIGNPYPCAISCSTFVTENVTTNSNWLQGTLYFWNQTSSFNSGDYASWNLMGGTASSNTPGTTPNGYIGTGQAFFVKSGTGGSSVCHFHNAMKATDNNTQYFTPDLDDLQTIKLSLTDQNQNYNEILLGFTKFATKDVDVMFDGEKLQGNPEISFYSKIENSDKDYAIQGRSTLTDADQINIGYFSLNGGTFTLKLNEMKDIDENTTVILEDKQLHTNTDLTKSDYTFISQSGEWNNRFVLHLFEQSSVIEDNTLQNHPSVYVCNNNLYFISDKETEIKLEIIDILGKIISIKSIQVNGFVSIQLPEIKGTYLLKITEKGTNRYFIKKIVIN